jgi:hypothetical protein
MTTWHDPVPEHAPLHPVNVEPELATALTLTLVPVAKPAEHVPGQEIPGGALVTVPAPVPAVTTVSVLSTNVAVTLWSESIVTVHVSVPEQPPPLQPVNVEPAAGVAVSVTDVPDASVCEQAGGHEIPAGELVTDPEPSPASVTVNSGPRAKVAVTARSESIVTVHVPVPEQPPPLHPVNVDPSLAGADVSVTLVPVS